MKNNVSFYILQYIKPAFSFIINTQNGLKIAICLRENIRSVMWRMYGWGIERWESIIKHATKGERI